MSSALPVSGDEPQQAGGGVTMGAAVGKWVRERPCVVVAQPAVTVLAPRPEVAGIQVRRMR